MRFFAIYCGYYAHTIFHMRIYCKEDNMRRFFNILDANSNNNFLTTQNARADIIGELEAIMQYEAHLNQTDNTYAIETIRDIVKEEMLHVGQLFGLLFYLNPESKTQFDAGLKEFDETMS